MKFARQTDRRLESFGIFPYVAWGLTISFTIFVFNLALNLQATAAKLQTKTHLLEQHIATPSAEIGETPQVVPE